MIHRIHNRCTVISIGWCVISSPRRARKGIIVQEHSAWASFHITELMCGVSICLLMLYSPSPSPRLRWRSFSLFSLSRALGFLFLATDRRILDHIPGNLSIPSPSMYSRYGSNRIDSVCLCVVLHVFHQHHAVRSVAYGSKTYYGMMIMLTRRCRRNQRWQWWQRVMTDWYMIMRKLDF